MNSAGKRCGQPVTLPPVSVNGGLYRQTLSSEYVGPNYQQINKRQEEIINAVKHLISDELCTKDTITGSPIYNYGLRFLKRLLKLKTKENYYGRIYKKPSKNTFKKIDPSECVRSELIIPTLKSTFPFVDVRYFNGSILSYALDSKFFMNFSPENEKHMVLLDMLFSIEDSLIEIGELGRDNAHIICKK